MAYDARLILYRCSSLKLKVPALNTVMASELSTHDVAMSLHVPPTPFVFHVPSEIQLRTSIIKSATVHSVHAMCQAIILFSGLSCYHN